MTPPPRSRRSTRSPDTANDGLAHVGSRHLGRFAGGLLIFLAAALGSISAAIGSGISFIIAAIAWYIGDFAEGNRNL